MKITKEQEEILRKQFSKLKKQMREQEKDQIVFVKSNCKDLLKICHDRWDYQDEDIGDLLLCSFEDFMHDLRN